MQGDNTLRPGPSVLPGGERLAQGRIWEVVDHVT